MQANTAFFATSTGTAQSEAPTISFAEADTLTPFTAPATFALPFAATVTERTASSATRFTAPCQRARAEAAAALSAADFPEKTSRAPSTA